MGACASIHKSPRVVIVGIGSKAKRIFTASPTKERPLNGKNPVGEFHSEEKHVESSELAAGSKEEFFFDSRAWLDSDCEDDFFSVNGDFTPSRGSTPNYQIIAPSTLRTDVVISVAKFADPNTEPSPTSRKKLADLFLEAKQDEKPLNKQNAAEENTYKLESVEFLKPLDSNPFGFEFNAPKKEKVPSTLRCCFPISPQRIGFDERSAKVSSRQCAV
ncbi:Uncharacterized protein ACMD2_05533 [Ananas comosus]|uniref:Uncharacterized protein n=1 Tax=Ananas comosus TaxID=4615 RepID=A0A199VIZ1_ANACO|nr:Uncharacterized protein ACMD2_05533 [Ananas comosus]